MINIELIGNLGVSDIDDSTSSEATTKNFRLLLGVGFTFKV
jgi:hypothetical protein